MASRISTCSLERIRLLAVFAMLGAILFISDILMEFMPNVHIVGVLTVIYTIVYRQKALIPIYVYVFLNGLFSGFGIWWLGWKIAPHSVCMTSKRSGCLMSKLRYPTRTM